MRELDFSDSYESSSEPVDGGFPGPLVTGTYAAPTAITAGVGVTPTNTSFEEIQYVEGDGGAVDITANPQIVAGTTEGQKLELVGTSDVNTLKLDNGNGLRLNGPCILTDYGSIVLVWSSSESVWRERTRNDMA